MSDRDYKDWPFLFVCLDKSTLDVMWGSDFNIVLAVDVEVICSALIGVLPLGTHIIFLLLHMALLACQLILLNDVGTSSFGLVF
jgi:predicted nucleic acid-binding protein